LVSKKPYYRHQQLLANTEGRDFFVGDLHGRFDALLLSMDDVSFNPRVDRIISVGDLIDRGLNSYDLLKLVNQPWFFAVRGNHEAMFLDANDGPSLLQWFANGGNWFMDLTGEEVLESYALANGLPVALTVATPDDGFIGVCHAEWPGEDWATVEESLMHPETVGTMLWGRTVIRENIHKWDKSATLTVHGHTPIEEVQKYGSAIYIDTGCVHGGKLTLIELKDALSWPLTNEP